MTGSTLTRQVSAKNCAWELISIEPNVTNKFVRLPRSKVGNGSDIYLPTIELTSFADIPPNVENI